MSLNIAVLKKVNNKIVLQKNVIYLQMSSTIGTIQNKNNTVLIMTLTLLNLKYILLPFLFYLTFTQRDKQLCFGIDIDSLFLNRTLTHLTQYQLWA